MCGEVKFLVVLLNKSVMKIKVIGPFFFDEPAVTGDTFWL
jgi:hypothetical protein